MSFPTLTILALRLWLAVFVTACLPFPRCSLPHCLLFYCPLHHSVHKTKAADWSRVSSTECHKSKQKDRSQIHSTWNTCLLADFASSSLTHLFLLHLSCSFLPVSVFPHPLLLLPLIFFPFLFIYFPTSPMSVFLFNQKHSNWTFPGDPAVQGSVTWLITWKGWVGRNFFSSPLI